MQTLDFITPVLDDPYSFGAVAAANALSDIYAMGAVPEFALNIVEFPVKTLPLDILEEILRGGSDKAKEAGVDIVGGHSIEDNAPKYGLSVTGKVELKKLATKSGACPGDVLFLTKPLGSGIITTAIDRGLAGEDIEKEIFEIMSMLNQEASRAMTDVGVNACTDVTGFGLLGHLYEMAKASGLNAFVEVDNIPVINNVEEFVDMGVIPTGTENNMHFLRDKVSWHEDVSLRDKIILSDAQTSGGLLIAVSEDKAGRLETALEKAGCLASARIGRLESKGTKETEGFLEGFTITVSK